MTVDENGILHLAVNGEQHILGRGVVDVLMSMFELTNSSPVNVLGESKHSSPECAASAWDRFEEKWKYSRDFLALRGVRDIVQEVKRSWA